MRTVGVSMRIGVPAQLAWEIVRTGSNMDRWVPAISVCKLDGQGVGATRVCMLDGHELHESIETVDDSTRLFQYRIHEQTMLPVRNIVGSIHLVACGAEETEVLWFVNFELEDESAWPAVRDGIEGIYRSGIDGLAVLARRASGSLAGPAAEETRGFGDCSRAVAEIRGRPRRCGGCWRRSAEPRVLAFHHRSRDSELPTACCGSRLTDNPVNGPTIISALR